MTEASSSLSMIKAAIGWLVRMKPPLTVEQLKAGGFEEASHWRVDEASLLEILDLPAKPGVYAFVVDGVAQYVGIASNSLHQRLRFYARPSATQRTSQRLNRTIAELCGSGVRIDVLIAFPSDFKWGGFAVKGAEGLEAGLISTFHLPWNIRGAGNKQAKARQSDQSSTPRSPVRKTGVARKIVELVRKRSGMTELEIAKAIYGPAAVQQQVNQHCRALVQKGQLERQGAGGTNDPFVYRMRN